MVRVLPFDDSGSSTNFFDIKYQMRLNDFFQLEVGGDILKSLEDTLYDKYLLIFFMNVFPFIIFIIIKLIRSRLYNEDFI